MPWFFLAQEHAAPEMLPLLTREQIPAMEFTIAQPRATNGLAFQVSTEHLDDVLRFLGLGHNVFTQQQTNENGILLLEPEPDLDLVSTPEGEGDTRTRRRSAADTADAFVVYVTAASGAQRAANERQLPELRTRVLRLEADLFTAAAQLRSVEEQLAVRRTSDDERAHLLRENFEAIKNDARVASVRSTMTELVIETQPLVLAASPPRDLGRFRITIGLTDANIRIEAMDKIAEYPHPNVSMRGIPYLGSHRDGLIRRLVKDEFAKVVRMLLDFLEEPPTGETIPAMRPDRWPEHARDGVTAGTPAAPTNSATTGAALAARLVGIT